MCGHSPDDSPVGHIGCDHAPRDRRPRSNATARQEDLAEADQAAVADAHTAGQPRSGSDVGELTEDAVVIDAASGVEDRMPADDRVGLNNRTRRMTVPSPIVTSRHR